MRLQGESGNEATGRVWKCGYRESMGMRLQGEPGNEATRCARVNSFRHATH